MIDLPGHVRGNGLIQVATLVSLAGAFTGLLLLGSGHRRNVESLLGMESPAEPMALRGGPVTFTATRPLSAGEAAVLRFRLRATSAEHASSMVVTMRGLRSDGNLAYHLVQLKLPVTGAWREWRLGAIGNAANAAGPLAVSIELPAVPADYELAGVALESWGRGHTQADLPAPELDYRGRDEAAAWRRGAEERIDRLRKADLRISVTDAAGRPVAGASVTVRMTRHAFPFGAVFHPDVLDHPRFAPFRDRYLETFVRLFNRAVFVNEMKWPMWDGPKTRERVGAALERLRAAGVDARGHCLVWPGPAKLPAAIQPLLDGAHNDQLAAATLAHVQEIATFYRGRVQEWDVLNEPTVHHRVLDLLGPAAAATWYRAAHEADPGARLVLNDDRLLLGGPRTESLLGVARDLLAAGAPLGAIADQAHFLAPEDIDTLAEGLDHLAAIGLPVLITELDVPGIDEQAQADFLRDFYTLAFSHPAVHEIVTWGFWEGTARNPGRGMLRADFSPKPSLGAYEDLVLGRWWTRADLRSGADGSCQIRGFKGDYDIVVELEGRRTERVVHLGDSGEEVSVTL
jgi:GH35 family endo-1,4-beta-xylanase